MGIANSKRSILMAGVPARRGTPRHFEHDDDTAFTMYNSSGKVVEVHTPPDSLRRIHELMHARHSDRTKQEKVYGGIQENIRQAAEDCRIHMRFWPWGPGNTPEQIEADARPFVLGEIDDVIKRAKEAEKAPANIKACGVFTTRLRAAAVGFGISGELGREISDAFRHNTPATKSEIALAIKLLTLFKQGKEGEAARMLQSAFFPVPEGSEYFNVDDPQHCPRTKGGGDGTGLPVGPYQPDMEIIELPLTETIEAAEVGMRLATSGPRLYRPALRRPVLPQRMFVRRTAIEPQGTILIDASGSMGDFDEVTRWCKKLPFATVAYYAGDGRSAGWLYIYAKDGFRAKTTVTPDEQGNTVDGPAMDWLLRQEGPRIMITDRGFCDAEDSAAQVQRLAMLEELGEIKVLPYLAALDEKEAQEVAAGNR